MGSVLKNEMIGSLLEEMGEGEKDRFQAEEEHEELLAFWEDWIRERWHLEVEGRIEVAGYVGETKDMSKKF